MTTPTHVHRLRAAIRGRERARLRKVAIVAGTVVAILLVSHGSFGAAILGGMLAASVCSLVDPRVSIAIGLLCLALYPVAALAERNAWLQQSPVVGYYAATVGLYSAKGIIDALTSWAFYFLGIGLVGRLARYMILVQEKSFDHA